MQMMIASQNNVLEAPLHRLVVHRELDRLKVLPEQPRPVTVGAFWTYPQMTRAANGPTVVLRIIAACFDRTDEGGIAALHPLD